MNLIQKIFIVWFLALSFIAAYNFYHNVSDQAKQNNLQAIYEQNRVRYEDSIREHDVFKAELNYLRGRADQKCTEK